MTDLMNQEIREYNLTLDTGERTTGWGIVADDGGFIGTIACKHGHITQNIHIASSGFEFCEGGVTYCSAGFDEFALGVNYGVKPAFTTAMEGIRMIERQSVANLYK
jgi:hypothetical protein